MGGVCDAHQPLLDDCQQVRDLVFNLNFNICTLVHIEDWNSAYLFFERHSLWNERRRSNKVGEGSGPSLSVSAFISHHVETDVRL